MAFPPLRAVEAAPVQHQGETFFCLTDPLGYVEQQVLLSPAAFFVAASLDGSRDYEAVRQEFVNQFGRDILKEDDVQGIVDHLDQHGFLATPRFEAIAEEARRAFRETPVRQAHFAGRGYPGEPDQLREFLDGFFTAAEGPGVKPRSGSAGSTPLRGVIVPHIDYHRGGGAYAHGYLRMVEAGAPDVVLVFGVAHAAPPHPFVLTRKDFETPLGVVKTDQAMVDALAEACAWDPFEHEIVHRTEHSIEFQAVMMAHVLGPDVRIVPVLCGSFVPSNGEGPDGVDRFMDACQRLVRENDGRMSVVASADLAHVGKRFGDDLEISDQVVEDVRRRDLEDLDHVLKGDALGFYQAVMADDNARRVCGLQCIYATLKSLEGAGARGPAELVNYTYAHDPGGGIVSFGNIVLP